MSFPGIFVLGFRDWFFDHLIRCLESIRRGAPDAPIVLADLGSRHAGAVREICFDFHAHTIDNIKSSGIWSRSLALNAAARLVPIFFPAAEALVFTDADMIFTRKWFEVAERLLAADRALDPGLLKLYLTPSRDLDPIATANLGTWWMPGLSDEELFEKSRAHSSLGEGAAMIVPRIWFEKVGGFDEFYKTWAAEDNDLVLRARWDGLAVEWLHDLAAVIHQYHRRDWPTPEQVEHVKQNRAYLAERIRERGPIVRNQKEIGS